MPWSCGGSSLQARVHKLQTSPPDLTRVHALALAAVLVAAAFAGCVGQPAPLAGGPAATASDAHATLASLLADVPCEAGAVGDATSENLKELARLDLHEAGEHGEIDIHGDLMLVSDYAQGGFEVVNISDPLEPLHVASFSTPGGLDVKFTLDGTGALVGSRGGVDVVDLRDPAHPANESSWEFPPPDPLHNEFQNAHMLFVFPIGGKEIVFLAPNSNDGVLLFELQGEPGHRALKMLSKFGSNLNGPLGPHDMWVTDDEDLKKPVLYVANGFGGWLAADVTDPANPKSLGGVLPELDPYQGYTHTIQAAKVGGRRLVATISEVGANAMKVYDATDLAHPLLLAEWTSKLVPLGPQHNLQIVGDKLLFAHYLEGAYVFNLTALPPAPVNGLWKPMAHFALDQPPPGTPLSSDFNFGGVWDVVVHDGLVYLSEMEFGPHIVGFGCFQPGSGWHSTG